MRKIKVVEFTNRLGFGGTEKTLYNFCKYIDRDRFDVSVCVLASDKNSGREMALRDLGVDVRVSSAKHLASYLKTVGADIFHIHRAGWAEPGAIAAAKLAGIPIVVEHNVFGRVDGSDEESLIDCHIFISYSCAWRYQMWVKHPLVTPRYEILYYPIDIDLFDRAGFGDRDYSRKSIGRIGRDDDTKWDFEFIKALPMVAEAHPDLEFHVIGITPKTLEYFRSAGLEKNLVIHPMTTDDDAIMRFYRGISVFTHFASMGETFGLVIGEAMAAKLPVVTHVTAPLKDSAQEELVTNGYNGIVASSADMYADGVLALLSSPVSAKAAGDKGYEKAMALYEAKGVTRGLEQIFITHARLKGII